MSFSPSFGVITLTPCVFLLNVGTCETLVLIMVPLSLINIIPSSSSTNAAETIDPFLSLVFIEITPCPPLLCEGKSSKAVFLPYPFSETHNIVFSGSAIIREISFSSFLSLIPLTPLAVLPIGLTCDSLNLINFPDDDANRISLSPEVIAVPTSLSSSSKFIALIPDLYFLENKLKFVFLVVPFLVAMKIN